MSETKTPITLSPDRRELPPAERLRDRLGNAVSPIQGYLSLLELALNQDRIDDARAYVTTLHGCTETLKGRLAEQTALLDAEAAGLPLPPPAAEPSA